MMWVLVGRDKKVHKPCSVLSSLFGADERIK